MNNSESLDWYHKKTREEADVKLKDCKHFLLSRFFLLLFQLNLFKTNSIPISCGKKHFTWAAENGVFLVRDSNTSPGDYVLSVLHNVSWNFFSLFWECFFFVNHKLNHRSSSNLIPKQWHIIISTFIYNCFLFIDRWLARSISLSNSTSWRRCILFDWRSNANPWTWFVDWTLSWESGRFGHSIVRRISRRWSTAGRISSTRSHKSVASSHKKWQSLGGRINDQFKQ